MHRVSNSLAVLLLVFTLIIGVYMASPWGNNDAYESPLNYLLLGIFLLWAVNPFIFIATRRNKLGKFLQLSRLVSVVIIGVGGVLALITSAFINVDPQGGLVLLFLPIYQWLIVGVSEFVGRFIDGRAPT